MAKTILEQLQDQLRNVTLTPEQIAAKGTATDYMAQMERERLMNSIGGTGQLTEAEAARIKQLMMQRQMDEFSRQNAYTSNPQAVPYYQQTNPLGNTMTNVPVQGGGMSVQQPMDLNSLIRMLSR
jgi:hypothetical protein